MYQFILFDLDGTLLDTLDDLTASVNYAMRKFGLQQHTVEEVRSYIGNGSMELIRRAIGGADVPFDGVLQAFRQYYQEHGTDATKPYDGVMEMLKNLQLQGKRCVVLSNKAHAPTQLLCGHYFGDFIELAVGERESEGIRKKPAPDAVYAVMQTLGATAENTVYIGDSEVDIQTAKNAAIPCISVTWGFKDRAFLLENGATVLVDDTKQLLQILSK